VQLNLKLDELLIPAKGGPSRIKGAVQVKNLDAPQFALGLEADRLDVDALQETFGGPADDEADKKPKKDKNPHGLSKETRALLADVNGKGTIRAGVATLNGMDLKDFKGVLVMTRGVAKFETLEFGFYGGSVTATGTKLDLAAERTGYDIKFEGKNIDVGAFVADQTSLGKIFKGTVSPSLDVKGRGLAANDFAITAEGPAELKFKSLQLDTLDLLGPIGDALKKSNKIPGMKLTAVGTQGTTWDAFTALTKFVGGKMKLQKPVETQTSAGKMTVEGAAGLNAGLDFDTVLDVPPETIAKMTGNKVKLKKAVPVPMKIGGTWDKPKVTGVDIGKLLKAIAEQLGGAALEDATDKATDAAKDAAKGKGGDAAKDLAGDLLGGDKDDKKKKKDKKKKSTADKAKDAVGGLLGK
jgi:AsmA protein